VQNEWESMGLNG